MHWIIYHVASGQIFFTGIALLLAGVWLGEQKSPRWRRWWGIAFVLGTLAIALSSTAIGLLFYLLAIAGILVWLTFRWRKQSTQELSYLLTALLLFGAYYEAGYQLRPVLHPSPQRALSVIGDSLTAGLGENLETWPEILSRTHRLSVQDLSRAGMNTSAALARVHEEPIRAPLLIIEIGGNDLLQETAPEIYFQNLEELLIQVSAEDREVLMFELPLLPSHYQFGAIQRALAQKYAVRLIPKRILMSVLATPSATTDTVHLSQSGQQLMAEQVWQVIEPAYRNVE